MGKVYHIAKNGSDYNTGTEKEPFLTISKAAKIAEEGDMVVVHAGTYRECVSPENGARNAAVRITYTAAEGEERPVIKGSEEISGWKNIGNDVWKASVLNTIFGEYNPYLEEIDGDWLMRPLDPMVHTGQLYFDGVAMSEVPSITEVPEKEMSWRAEVNEKTTVFYANFGDKNPNETLTEINVRKCCFYPEKTGINYITVRGFEMAHAATTWAPPTANQPGMLGTHWSKGWIIEDNILHDARCSAISVGKAACADDNLYNRYHRKPGYQYQLEMVFNEKRKGWDKETIGSHIIRNNTIYDCGQNGIVGHMGGAFSEIYNNHIYNIGNKGEFFGYEIAGIKLHAAIDTQIHHNHIHDCLMGTWLDWQAQGVRLSSNLYHHNECDAWMEVTHGPHLLDNNIFGSKQNLKNAAQGGAYVHNLFCGATKRYDVRDRSTPYHFPHSTEFKGTAVVYGFDDRFYNNIFVDTTIEIDKGWCCGTEMYEGCPSTLEEYIRQAYEVNGKGDVERYLTVNQPAYMADNYYADGTKAYEGDVNCVVSKKKSNTEIVCKEDGVYLEIELDKVSKIQAEIITTEKLGVPRITEAPFENPDGTPISINKDFFGKDRKGNPSAGPIEGLSDGKQSVLLWKN